MSFLRKIGASLKPVKRQPVTCPYCGAALDIEPERKQKCPVCGKTMHAKRLPSEESKRFVTEEEAATIESAWEVHYKEKRTADLEQRVKDAQKGKNRYEELTARAQLEGELGHHDKAWGFFNQALIEAMKSLQFGLYRNTKFDMAMLVQREKRYRVEAQLLSEVAYFDYCRCTNMPIDSQGRPLNRCPAFQACIAKAIGRPDAGPDPDFAPGLLYEIQAAMREGQIDLLAFREIFMSVTQQIHQSTRAPYPPADALTALEKELAKHGSKGK